MQTTLKLVILVLIHNLVRYFVGGPIESVTIMEPMHRVMPMYPDVFDADFTSTDIAVSLAYNYAMWFVAAVVFHLLCPVLDGPMVVRSLKSYALMGLFFCALAAVYMNHYTVGVKSFYLWSMVDALILFPLVGITNGLLYPYFFPQPKPCGNPP